MAPAATPRTTAQVIDRSSSSRRLRVEVRQGLGLEGLLSLFVLNQSIALERYEQAPKIKELVSGRLPAAVDRALKRFRTPAGDVWLSLVALVAATVANPEPAAVIRRLSAMKPAELKAVVLGVHQRTGHAVVIRRAAAGERGAVNELLEIARMDGFREEVAPILRIPTAELPGLIIRALEKLPSRLYAEADVAPLLERNAAEANRRVAGADDPRAAIEQLAGQGALNEDRFSEVILVPSLILRPLTLVLTQDHAVVICYPALLDDQLRAPEDGLIDVYRALGDGTRLRILRRLAAGKASVAKISAEFGLAKSTVWEHLLSLREAGLVRLPTTRGFTIEPELPDLNWMLKEFLGLEMRRSCETCGKPLEADAAAFICSYECTYCPTCAKQHRYVCPNCQGELVSRPKRAKNRSAGRRPAARSRP